MKIVIAIEAEIDGEMSDEQKEQAFEYLVSQMPSVITSEDVDGGKDFALLINSVEVQEEKGQSNATD